MAPRVYALVWLLVVASAALFYATGNVNDLILTIFGFIFATLFAGFFLAVLPWWAHHIHEPKYYTK